ncbi:MAG: CGNR zinc finger domain-containing protein [Rhodococcus sp. (in: high G+C Gram-positive bacteria)]|uniref:CGNR zinc finger domain-containing protein n=1 Tax=Rhodococcus sp. TaxID=1831 RepID=UPI003BAEC7EE
MDEHPGGAPLLGEPLPIELINTTYAVRGRPQEGLCTPEQLATWLRDVKFETDDVTDSDLAAARELRDATRAIASATVHGEVPDQEAVATLNRYAESPPRWRELRTEPEFHSVSCTSGTPVAAALAAIAADAVDLFGGPLRHKLRACGGPGCVLYFIKDRPRREWCSHGCGNRGRAARHYARTRQSDQSPEAGA